MRYGIISAIPEEQQAILNQMEQGRNGPRSQVICGRTFYEGVIGGTPVVSVQSGIGKVSASLTAALLLQNYGVDRVLFLGVAGSVSEFVKRGDVVLANNLFQYDFDCSPIFDRYEIPGTGLSQFPTDKQFNEHITWCLDQVSSQHKARVHIGAIASGDQFVKSKTLQIKQALEAVPTLLAVEMEGAAVAQVCYDFQVPLSVIRIISDETNHQSEGDFTTFIQETQPFTNALVFTLFHSVN